MLAESNVPDANFSGFTVPNVDHEKVASWQLEMSGLRGQKMKFDRNAMAVQETLVNCSRGCVNAVQNRRIQQLLQSMTTEQPVLKSMDVDSKSRQTIESELPQAISKLRPISFDSSQSGVELSSSLNLSSINFGGALVKYVGKCRVSIASPGLLHLQEGEILLSAPKQTTIKVGSAHVQVKAGTIATIGVRDGLVKVRNIFEKKRTSVLAVVDGKRSIGVQVGQELIIGPQGIPLSKALSDDPVGRRHLSSLDLSSGHTCISSEVSLSSLLQNSAVLAQLLRSSGEQDRDLARRVMKMAVCVSIVTQSHGNYSMVNP